ncbi:MAG: type II secretion system F family protein, partial [Candidatus Omnitrophica bacterium]|nr:type II secretion system F family protein [Candidatus Omnitrophota bacterium]
KPKVSSRKLCTFTRQIATLQEAGVPLIQSLESTKEQTDDKVLKQALKDIIEQIRSGESFSSALSLHRRIFSDLYINMVKVAESGGLLAEVLERLANLLEYEEDTKSRIKSATRYPVIVMSVLAAAFIALITLVVPRFLDAYKRFNMQLPLPTRILIGLNFIIMHYWWAILIVLIIIVFLLKRSLNTQAGRLFWDSLQLKMPIFGPLIVMLTMSRFSRILAILIKSGVPILETLGFVSLGVGNAAIAKVINGIKTGVAQGQGLSGPMKISKFFPPMIVQMVAVGEETGKLSSLLLKVSDYYDRQAEYIIKNLSTLLEPILIIILGLGVLVMALGIFLPMWNLVYMFKR